MTGTRRGLHQFAEVRSKTIGGMKRNVLAGERPWRQYRRGQHPGCRDPLLRWKVITDYDGPLTNPVGEKLIVGKLRFDLRQRGAKSIVIL